MRFLRAPSLLFAVVSRCAGQIARANEGEAVPIRTRGGHKWQRPAARQRVLEDGGAKDAAELEGGRPTQNAARFGLPHP